MLLFSNPHSPDSSPPRYFHDEPLHKSAGAEIINEPETPPYTTSESSGFSSRESSPHSEMATSLAPCSSADNTEVDLTCGIMHPQSSLQPLQVGAIDPRLLTAPCGIIISDYWEVELPRSTSSIFGSPSVSPCPEDIDNEEHDNARSREDDEYLPPDQERRLRKGHRLRKRCSPRATNQRTLSASPSPSPGAARRCSKNRSRNKPVSTDAVAHELSRIAQKKVTAERKTTRRKNKNLSCQLCGTSFTRSSDLHRHVLTHDPSRNMNSAVCIGLSMQQALELGIDYVQLKKCFWKNEWRIGGCGEHFSRTDALLRHVKLTKSQCLIFRTGQLIGPGQ